ncbi:MAG: thiolase family protein [Chloroflexi bacterium]|nr:thiolase family protein [Chloroflexota bacterium]
MSAPRILGVGMTRFGRHPDRSLKDLAREAVALSLSDAGLGPEAVQMALVGNAMAGTMTGQESVRGQVVLQDTGIGGVPIVNVENACASSSTALHLACNAVVAGQAECVLVVGVEKLYHPDRRRTLLALAGAAEVTENTPAAPNSSPFMEIYAERVRRYLHTHGLTAHDLAWIASKNHGHAVENPLAQYREPYTPEEVLASPMVAEPLTRLMCSPITDGAAAAVVTSERFAREQGRDGVAIRASVLVSGHPSVDEDNEAVLARAAAAAYATAGAGPDDVDVAEVHDAAASGELLAYAPLGLCRPGEESRLIADGFTALGGTKPVNPSGGLETKGNPSGATGLGQIAELVCQLRGQAGARQVPGARIAVAENAGGTVADRTAAVCIHVLAR